MSTAMNVITSEMSQLIQEAPKLAEAITQTEKLTAQLPVLLDQARKAEIKSMVDYGALGQVLTQVRGLRAQGEAQLSPFNILVDRVRTFLRTAVQRHTNRCEEIEGIIKPKLKAWEKAEQEAAAAEQAKLNKAAEKAGTPPVTVKPNIAPVEGYRRSTRYWAEVVGREKFMRAYRSSPKDFDRFLVIDVQKLSAELRESKDLEAFMKKYPGIQAHKD